MGQNVKAEWLNHVYKSVQYFNNYSCSIILMTVNLNSPVIFTFMLRKVPYTDQYVMKVIPLYYKIYLSSRNW